MVNVEDVHSDPRWPNWSSAVVRLPIRSVISTPLQHQQTVIGAMKVYSAAENAFTSETERLLTMFDRPAVALRAHVQTKDLPMKLSESISTAMSQCDMINIAKGVLMAQHGFDKDAATLQLIQLSRAERVTMGETARRIMAARQRQDSNPL